MLSRPFSAPIAATSAGVVYTDAIYVGNQLVMAVEIANGAAAALTGFVMQLKDHDEGEFYDFLTATEFGDGIGNNILFIKGALATLASSGKGHLHARTNGARYARFGCQLASGIGTVTVRGGSVDV
ncbi:MAG TPA: hypothetical protein VHM90_02890 [Phycisphaerae bacterium]|nr:hypothetical protein [Phycisphaerae bacterium]